MAGQSRIVARIASLSYSSGIPDTDSQFIIQYRCTGPVSGEIAGEVILQADVTQNEAQIATALKTGLVAIVNAVVTPPQAYAANDVRGLTL